MVLNHNITAPSPQLQQPSLFISLIPATSIPWWITVHSHLPPSPWLSHNSNILVLLLSHNNHQHPNYINFHSSLSPIWVTTNHMTSNNHSTLGVGMEDRHCRIKEFSSSASKGPFSCVIQCPCISPGSTCIPISPFTVWREQQFALMIPTVSVCVVVCGVVVCVVFVYCVSA